MLAPSGDTFIRKVPAVRVTTIDRSFSVPSKLANLADPAVSHNLAPLLLSLAHLHRT